MFYNAFLCHSLHWPCPTRQQKRARCSQISDAVQQLAIANSGGPMCESIPWLFSIPEQGIHGSVARISTSYPISHSISLRVELVTIINCSWTVKLFPEGFLQVAFCPLHVVDVPLDAILHWTVRGVLHHHWTENRAFSPSTQRATCSAECELPSKIDQCQNLVKRSTELHAKSRFNEETNAIFNWALNCWQHVQATVQESN